MAEKRRILEPDLYLYTTMLSNPTRYVYELEVAKFQRVYFTVDFTNSVNFELKEGGLTKDTMVQPYSRTTVGVVHMVDPTQRAGIKCRFEWVQEDPDEDAVRELVTEDMARIDQELGRAATFSFGDDSASVARISRTCEQYGVQYVDPEFPPTAASLYAVGPNGRLASDGKPVTWRRPAAFMKGPYKLFEDAIEPADIRQGALGDCWFMCALASIAEFPELVRFLFSIPGEELSLTGTVDSNASGVYKIKLCKNGEWTVVTVDDYFPCFPGGGPIYSRSHGNELWVLLVEKAYAKLHRNYHQLKLGFEYEAMMDLTGAPTMTLRFDDEDIKADIDSGKLWEDLLRFDREGALMSLSTPGEDVWTETGEKPDEDASGLVAGHAYSLISVVQTRRDGHKLLKIRNPWGNFEWGGDWGDDSDLWTEELIAELDMQRANDGTFWMCWEDALEHFRSANVCMVRHHNASSKRWAEHRRRACFSIDGNGQVTTNMFQLQIDERTSGFLAVHQEDERVATAHPYLDVGVALLRFGADYRYELVAATGCSAERQSQVQVDLEPGQYLVVPTTTGCKFQEARSAAAEAGSGSVRLFDDNGKFVVAAEACLHEIFRRLDADMDGLLNRDELDAFMAQTEDTQIDEEVFQWIMEHFDSRDGGLTPDGFVQAYLFMFEASGRDEEATVWRDLEFFGYSRSLQLVNARSVVVSLHTDDDVVAMGAAAFDSEAYEEAMELPIKKFGKATEQEDGKIRLWTRKSGYAGVSFAVENLDAQRTLRFSLDCRESQNVISHTGSLEAEVDVPPGEMKVLHHLAPAERAAWSWAYSSRCMWV